MQVSSSLALACNQTLLTSIVISVVGVIWGVSNVLLDKYVSFQTEDPATSQSRQDLESGELLQELNSGRRAEPRPENSGSFKTIFSQLIRNKSFLLIYGLTQIGSIWYSIFIRFTNIGFGVMCAYGISLLVSYLLEVHFGWCKISKRE